MSAPQKQACGMTRRSFLRCLGLIIGSLGFHQLARSPQLWAKEASSVEYLPFEHRIQFLSVDGAGWPGVAIFDYDNDGHQDLYLTNGEGYPNALLKNDGTGHFIDVARQVGVAHLGQGSGVATADLDNDGFAEIFVGNMNGPNVLYHGRGDGTYEDVAQRAGVAGANAKNTTSILFADFDNDGLIDIYVQNRYDATHSGSGPQDLTNHLYHNNGDGTFTDIAEDVGVAQTHRPTTRSVTHVAVAIDYDADGDQDLLVAEDGGPIELYRNLLKETGNLRFERVTEEAGLIASGNWMGLAVADFDGDGREDIFATNWGTSSGYPFNYQKQMHALYHNNGDGTFTDIAQEAGVARWEFGWGTSALDWDNDGLIDLFYAGNFMAILAGMKVLDNPGHLFINKGDGAFIEASGRYGIINRTPDGQRYCDARGVAVGDLNGDGLSEIVIANSGDWDLPSGRAIPGIPVLCRNPGNGNHWLKIRLVGTSSNRDGLGAQVTMVAGGRRQIRTVRSGSSFLSQDSRELIFGLGQESQIERIEVHWPSGIVQALNEVKADQLLLITEPIK